MVKTLYSCQCACVCVAEFVSLVELLEEHKDVTDGQVLEDLLNIFYKPLTAEVTVDAILPALIASETIRFYCLTG